MAKLKKIAKKIYDKIKSEEGQIAVKGLTVATILAGLTALIGSRMSTAPRQLSQEELKEQYMESIGESVLF
jgi:tyrosyl-tRNA synthetase